MSVETNKFLLQAVAYLSQNVPNSSFMQSQMLEKVSQDNATNTRCPFCRSILTNSCRLKIEPKQMLLKKMRQRLRRAALPQFIKRGKFETSLVEKCLRNKGNTMVSTCLVCKKKNIQRLSKPKPVEMKETGTDSINNSVDLPSKKKKKKKKDKLAGIKVSGIKKATKSKSVIHLQSMECSETNLKGNMKKSKVVSSLQTITPVASATCQKTDVGHHVEYKNSGKKKVSQLLQNSLTSGKLKSKQKKTAKIIIPTQAASVPVAGKKFKKGGKLAEMLASADAAKLSQKKVERKTNFLPALQLLLHK